MRTIVKKIPNGDGTYTVLWSDGTLTPNMIITGTTGGDDRYSDVAGTIGGAISHTGDIANNIFNPFQTIISAMTEETPETRQLRANARKFGLVSVLLVLAVLFIYIIFKDA